MMNHPKPPHYRIPFTAAFLSMAFTILTATLPTTPLTAAESGTVPPTPEQLQQQAAEIAMNRGLDWLVSIQQESGAWSNTNFPALTAMPLWAMARSGRQDLVPAITKATQYLLSCVKQSGPDKGAIYIPVPDRKGGGLSNYNTALAAIALHAVYTSPLFNNPDNKQALPDLAPVILDARAFLAASQYKGESIHHGGMGYDPPTGRSYADLSNSYLGYEAMHLTQGIEEFRQGSQRVSLDWDAALKFVQRIQNLPEYNDLPWATDDPAEKGGFSYQPDTFREDFGAITNANGVLKYRSALTMSYAGLASYIYIGLQKTDPRIKAAMEWISNNWQPDISNRNPDLAGKPEQMGGYFYYLNVLTRSLATYGSDTLTKPDGSKVDWRHEILSRILNKQQENGSWLNEYGRYWEADPVLSSSYTLLAIQNTLGL